MPSDSVTAFLAFARRSRLIPEPVADELAADPAVPRAGVGALCDDLVTRGVLTDFQARYARAGEAPAFAGYAILEDLGPGPGGHAYRATHPTTGDLVELRRLSADDLLGEPVTDFLARAHAASELPHPHLARVLDVGTAAGDVFVTLEPDDGADLAALVADIGPMPAELACRFAAHAADGLVAAHAQGLTHGALSTAMIRVGPLDPLPGDAPRRRPATGAAARLTGLGVIPRRPGVGVTPADDVRALGVALAHLLAGRPAAPADVSALRPDLPAGLVELIGGTQVDPPAATEVAARLGALFPTAPPLGDALGDLVDAALAAPGPPDPAPFTPAEYVPGSADDTPHIDLSATPDPPPPRPAGPDAKSNVRLWVAVAAGLWLLAVPLLWLVLIYRPFGQSPPPAPPARKGR